MDNDSTEARFGNKLWERSSDLMVSVKGGEEGKDESEL